MPNPLVVTRLILPNAAASAGGAVGPGAQSLTQSATFTETDTFFTPVVAQPSAQTLTQSATFTETDTFYTPTVAGVQALTQTAIFTETDTFYTPAVIVTLAPSLFAETDTYYTHVLAGGVLTLQPSLFNETDTFFTPAVAQPSAQTLTQSATFTETDTFYAPTVNIGGHRAWRMNITAASSACSLTELEFWDGATKLDTTGKTIIASGEGAGSVKASVFDGDTSSGNWWYSGDVNSGWIGVDFGTPVNVTKIGVVGRYGGGQYPTDWNIQWSDDVSAWTTKWSNSAGNLLAYSNATTKWWFTDPTAGFKHWRLRFQSDSSGAVRIAEAQLRATIGGADISGNAFARQVQTAVVGNTASLFDGNAGTEWAATTFPAMIFCYFPDAQVVAQVMLQAGTDLGQAPDELRVDSSLDGSNWTNEFTQTGFAAWTTSEIRTYVVGSQTLTPALFTETDIFFTPTVIPGSVTLTPALFIETDIFYAPTVEREPEVDPYWENVVLLSGWNGTNGATTYVAETGQTHTFGTGQSLSSTQAKFGTTSLAGGSASGSFPTMSDWDLADDNNDAYTIEFWSWLPNLSGTVGWLNANWNFDGWMARADTTNMELHWNVEGGSSASIVKTSAGFVASTWQAIAITKSTAGVVRFFIDGVKVNETTPADSSIETVTGVLLTMGGGSGAYLDEIRITKGVDRIGSSNYTPRAEAFPRIGPGDPYWSYCVLLFGANGTNGSTTIPDEGPKAKGNATVNGNAQITTSSPLNGTGSLLLDGTGDSIQWTMDSDLQLNLPSTAAALFTIDFTASITQAGIVMGSDWNGVPDPGWFIQAISDGSFRVFGFNGSGGSGWDFTTSTGAWVSGIKARFRVDSDGNTLRMYKNGVMIGSDNTPGAGYAAFVGTANYVRFGDGDFAGAIAGRLDEVRIYNGVCLCGNDNGFAATFGEYPRVASTGVMFLPTELGRNVLKGWYDTTVTGAINDAGSGASSWLNDRSGCGNHLAQGTSGSRPITGTQTHNGYNVLDFDGTDDYLERSTNLDIPTGDTTLIVLNKVDTGTQAGLMYILGAAASFGTSAALGRESGNMAIHGNNTTNGNSPATAALFADTSTSWRIISGLQSTTSRSIYENGLLKNTNSGAITQPGSQGVIRLGNCITFDRTTARYIDGKIAHAFALNETDPIHQALIEGFVAYRHGMVADLDAAHAYKYAPPISNRASWLPTHSLTSSTIKGWFRGGDLTGSNNDPLAQWGDASGNSNNATQSGASGLRPTLITNALNGINGVRFTAANTQWFDLPNLLSGASAGAMFIVLQAIADPAATGASSGSWTFGSEVGVSAAGAWPYTDGTVFDGWGSTARKSTGNPTASLSSAYRIVGIHSAASNWALLIDGVTHFATGTNTVGFTSTPWLGRSQASGGVFNYADYRVVEVLILNAVPARWLRLRIEGYLAHKFGLTGNLASTHAYKILPPRALV